MVLAQKWSFFNLSFLGNIGQENVSYDILEQTNTLLGYKKKEVQKVEKMQFFQRGQLMVLVQKWPFFQLVFFQAIQARKMCFTIFQNEKTPFQAIKTRSSKSRKIDIFPKGLTHSFGPKMAIFPTFFFRQYRPGKCLLRYSRTKKRLSRL